MARIMSIGVGEYVGPNTTILTFTAGGAITASHPVIFDVSQSGSDKSMYVKDAPAGSDLVAGVALETVSSGEKVQVAVGGYVKQVKAKAGISAGKVVAVDGGTAGQISEVQEAGAAGTPVRRPLGVTLTAEAGGTCEVLLWNVA